MKIYESLSIEDTRDIAAMLADSAGPGDVIALMGPMGAGKTAFSKAFAKALGVSSTVNSPTFTLLNIYDEGRITMYHFDCYRIEDPDEIYAIGFDDYIYGEGVCVIEWAELIKDILPLDSILVKIEVLPEGRRIFTIDDRRDKTDG